MEYVNFQPVDLEVKYKVKLPTFEKYIPTFDYTNVTNPNFGRILFDGSIYDNLLDLSQDVESSIKNIGNFNVNAAVKELHKNVNFQLKSGQGKITDKNKRDFKLKDPNVSGHRCAVAVRLALEAGGINTLGRPNEGGNYGAFLKLKGWIEVNDTPQPGDIAVTKPHGAHKSGHVAMFDGSKWISDYILRDKFVYKSANNSNTTIYRYQG